jgi:hypothetical protein
MEENAISIEIEKLNRTGHHYTDLTISNPTNCNITYPKKEIIDTIIHSELFRHQPNPQGDCVTRKAVASYHAHGITEESIVLTSSSSEAYSWLFKLLCDPNDEIIVSSPSYPLFHWLAALENIRVSVIPTIKHERWNIDLQSLEKAITKKTRALVMVNPNNPTGQFLSRNEWSSLLLLCSKYNIALLVDEVFKDYILEPEDDYLPTALEEIHHNCTLFVISGISKLAALPQIKISWIIAASKQAQKTIEKLLFIADQYLSVSAVAQIVTPKLLQSATKIQSDIMQHIHTNLNILDLALVNYPHISRLRVGGGWSVIMRRPAVTPIETFVLQLLKMHKVLVHPGYFFDLPGDNHIVISLLPEMSAFRNGIDKILKATM